MVIEENLGNKIDQTGKEAQYDNCAKRLLSEKIVLAFILKYAVPEFAAYSIDDIRDCYIEGIEVAKRGVDIDESNVDIASLNEGSEITGENVESTTKTEGKIVYDIIFDVIVPSSDELMRLIINIEAQKDDPEKYELVTRGIYYCGRMISAQKNKVFAKSNYHKLRKVYSIWVCMNPKNEMRKNTMNMYPIVEQNIIGNYKADKKSYDKASVIIITLGKQDESEVPILNFLEILLSNVREPEQKKTALLDTYGIKTTPEMDKEMSEMCNLSKGIAEENHAMGRAMGKREGADNILTLMQKLFAAGRIEDAQKASNDKEYCQKLLMEFGLAK